MSEKLLTDTALAVAKAKENIEKAAETAGRDPKTVRLMAVTKTVPPEIVNEVVDTGCDLFGENRVQEFLSKYESYDKEQKYILSESSRRTKSNTLSIK